MSIKRAAAFKRYQNGTIRWTECRVIERDPERMHGAWCFRDTRIPVANFFQALAAGISTRVFVKTHDGPYYEDPDIVLEFLREQLDGMKEALWQHGGPRAAKPPALEGGRQNRSKTYEPDTTHWKDCGVAWRDAERMTGSWCVNQTRFPLATLFDNFSGAATIRQFVEWYQLEIHEIIPVLQFVADDLNEVWRQDAPPRYTHREDENAD